MTKITQPIKRFHRVAGNLKTGLSRLLTGTKYGTKKTKVLIQNHPFPAFFAVLVLLILLIILGNTVFRVKPAEEKSVNPIKQVHIYSLGTAPKVAVQAKVEKSGVIQIVAQTSGIVNSINISEGGIVNKGQVLINLASNYQGGNAMSLSRQLAQNQYNLSQQTFNDQKESIEKNRQVAEKSDANNDQLRDIQNRSLDESRSLLDLNESIASSLRSNLSSYEASNSAGANSALILQTQSSLSQVQSAINQLRGGIRSTEYQSASDRPPAELSNLQREITLKQLDIQEKSLEVNKEMARIQYQLAAVNEAMMYPAAPFAATVERVFVKVGQQVNSGTVLATLTASAEDPIKLDALVSEETAKNLSISEESVISINGKMISMHPSYVSTEATTGQLYSVIFILDDTYSNLFTDSGYVSIQLPVGASNSSDIIPFIPIDSVFQTQDESYVFVINNGHAQVKKIKLGSVQGKFVAVEDGVSKNDQIITDRSVIEGDSVQVVDQM